MTVNDLAARPIRKLFDPFAALKNARVAYNKLMCDEEATMHFNVYLDVETGKRLTEAAQQAGENRSAVIRRAVQEWLARRGKPQWPEAVISFAGEPDMPAFETGREYLRAAKADPLA